MRKSITFSAVLMLLISLIVISCSPADMQASDDDHVELFFDNIDAKAVDTTAFTKNGTASWGSASVAIGAVSDYYWSYTAVKGDKLYTDGQVTSQTAFNTGKGLSGTKNFSRGKWTFTLYAYASEADRTAGKQYLFSGTTTNTYTGASATVPVTMNYAYIAGTGTASIKVTTSISQPTNPSGITETYKISKVEAILADSTTVTLTSSDNTNWSVSTSIASGAKTVKLKIYVADETGATVTSGVLGTAYVLHGLTTNISASAKVTISKAGLSATFNATLPTAQPTASSVK